MPAMERPRRESAWVHPLTGAPPPIQAFRLTELSPEAQAALLRARSALQTYGSRSARLELAWRVEMSVLEQFLFKTQNRFRHDKGHQDLRLLVKAARRLTALALSQLAREFQSDLPLGVDVSQGRAVYAPSRDTLRYLLGRLLGASELLDKLQIYGGLAGGKQLARIRLGHFWHVALQNLGAVGRLWHLSRELREQIVPLYQALMPLELHLSSSGTSQTQIPSNFQFPPLDSDAPSHQNDPLGDRLAPTLAPPARVEPDLGVVIERIAQPSSAGLRNCAGPAPSPQSPQKRLSRPNARQLVQAMASWQCTQDLVEFLQSESKLRKVDRQGALSKTLDATEWKRLKCDLLSETKSAQGPKALGRLKKRVKHWFGELKP